MPHLEIAGKIENIKAPGLPGDIGYDLLADETMPVAHGIISKIPTGVRVAVPSGYWGLIIARSSANNRGILVLPGVIDSGYRGLLYIYATMLTGQAMPIYAGTAIAQLILIPGGALDIRKASADFESTCRGQAGFGSTGHST